MQVKKRLQINMIVTGITALIIALILLIAYERVKEAVKGGEVADLIVSGIFERFIFREDFIRSNNPRAVRQWLSKNEQINSLLETAATEFTHPDDKQLLADLVTDNQSITKLFSTIIQNRKKAAADPETAARLKQIEARLLTQINIKTYDSVLHARYLQEASNRHIFSQLKVAGFIILGIIATVFLAAIVNSWAVGKMITERFAQLRHGSKVIGSGNLDYSIIMAGNDEFTELSRAFNSMTEKLKAQIKERREAEERLQQSETRLTLAQRAGRVGVFDWDLLDGQAIWSRQLEELFGLPSGGFERNYEGWAKHLHPDDRPVLEAQFQTWTAERRRFVNFEYRFIRVSDQQIRFMASSAEYTYLADGTPARMVGTNVDITERKRAEEELRKSKEQLELRVQERTQELTRALHDLRRENEEKLQALEELRNNERMLIQQSRMAAMGEMIGNISHQWRQPLNMLGLIIQEIAFSYNESHFSAEYLEKSVDKAMQVIKDMSQTIDDFRNFFKPERRIEAFHINEALEKTILLMEGDFKQLQIKLDIDVESECPVKGLRNEFSQVLLNILANARDAFRDRKVAEPRIAIRTFCEEGKSVITISDNAGGIPIEIIGRVFDAYFTTKGAQKGTGIGLFMSKTIIEKNMNGRLSVRNTGEGAEFRIEV